MSNKDAIFRTHLDIADIYHQKYSHTDMTIAMLDKEDALHFVLKLLGFCFVQSNDAVMNTVISAQQPDVYIENLLKEYELWLEAGWPENKKLNRALHSAKKVMVINTYDNQWESLLSEKVKQHPNFTMIELEQSFVGSLTEDLALKLIWNVVIDQSRLSVSVAEHYYESSITLKYNR